nr:VQ motif-containing protein 9 [Ipomoea batatas]
MQQQAAAPQQQQPPVYNINKSDFRDVVQKLTGSPAHERISTPPPIHQPKPPSSRLQRIRPPPLVQIGNRPSPLLTVAGPPILLPSGGGFLGAGLRPAPQPQPLSPLPPFPAVHAAAESPISAYMRFLHTSFTAVDSDSKRFSTGLPPLAPLASPRWNTFAPPPPPLPPPPPPASSAAILPQFPAMPSSPLPFSCLPSPSPRSPCALLSPNLLLSPAGQLGFPQLPLSPTVPVSSPTWKGPSEYLHDTLAIIEGRSLLSFSTYYRVSAIVVFQSLTPITQGSDMSDFDSQYISGREYDDEVEVGPFTVSSNDTNDREIDAIPAKVAGS